MRKIPLLLINILLIQLMSACSGNTLKKDESIIFFPTSAVLDEKGGWLLPVHYWVFEKEENDISRKISQKLFSEVFESLGVSEQQANSPVTKKRLMWFLVDNKRNKKIQVIVKGQREKLTASSPNGHGFSQLKLTNKIDSKGWVSVKTVEKYHRDFSGEVQLIPETGLSIISDIDDTIKVSNVLNKKELIKNIFVKPYQVTLGFPNYYKKLKQQGAYFHYISASPWQIYPSLKPFMDKHYPKGTISMRNFRLKDSSILSFLQSSAKYKIEQISHIIKRYPKQQFILIGDSGEHDPEVYAAIYHLFPDNIQSIQIRSVEGSNLSNKRFSKTFKDIPEMIWQVISNPLELKK